MGTATKEKKLKDEEIKYDVNQIEEDHVLGKLVQDEMASHRIVDPAIVPVGYKRQVKIDGEVVNAFMSIRTPDKVDPDTYYPCTEWRINPETLDGADYWPQWKVMPVVVNGQELMEDGRKLLISYYVMNVESDMPEEEDGRFFIDAPFSRTEIKESDIGLPMIKGEIILAFAEAKKTLAGQYTAGASRRRVG